MNQKKCHFDLVTTMDTAARVLSLISLLAAIILFFTTRKGKETMTAITEKLEVLKTRVDNIGTELTTAINAETEQQRKLVAELRTIAEEAANASLTAAIDRLEFSIGNLEKIPANITAIVPDEVAPPPPAEPPTEPPSE